MEKIINNQTKPRDEKREEATTRGAPLVPCRCCRPLAGIYDTAQTARHQASDSTAARNDARGEGERPRVLPRRADAGADGANHTRAPHALPQLAGRTAQAGAARSETSARKREL